MKNKEQETPEEFRHRMDDELINPLTGIYLLAYRTNMTQDLHNQVTRIIQILEKEKIINPRLDRTGGIN